MTPFSAVTISDGENDNVTVTVALDTATKGTFTAASLTASGFVSNNNGTYTLSARSPANAQAAIRQLVFSPAANRVTAGSTETTTFTITAADANSSPTNTTTTVIATSINDAPVLADTVLTMTGQNEDCGAPSGAVGTAISALAGGISDADASAAKGIAVIGADTANGTWWYSVNNGGSWSALGAVTTSNARLIASTNGRMYFQPNADWNGTISPAITLRAWDGTSGANGTLADPGAGGGTTAFSTASDTAALTITAVNDPPTLSTTTATPSFTEGGSAVSLFSGTAIGINSGDSGQAIKTLTLTVSNVADGTAGTAEVLVVDGSDVALNNGSTVASTTGNGFAVSVSRTGTTSTVTITKAGNFTTTQAQSLVDGLQYKNTSSDPSTGNTRVVTLTSVQDDGGTANGGIDTTILTAHSDVSLSGVNTAPTLTATATTPTYVEGNAAVSLFSGAAVSAVEAAQKIQQITLSVAGLADGANEILKVDGTDVVLTDATSVTSTANSFISTVSVTGGTATVTITKAGNFTGAQAQALVNGLTYRDTVSGIVVGTRTVTLTQIKDDGGTSPGVDTTTLSTASTVTVSPVNHVPTLSTTTSTPGFTEGGSAVSLFSGTAIGIGTNDNSAQSIKTLTFTVGNVTDGASEIITIDGQDVALTVGSTTTTANAFVIAVSGVGATKTVTVTKSGNYTTAQAQTLVDGLKYKNSSNDPTVANRVFTLTGVQDSGGTAGGGVDTATPTDHSDVSITAVNTQPTFTTTPGSSVSYTESQAAISLFSGTAASPVEAAQKIQQITLTVSGLADGASEILVVDGTDVTLTNATTGTSATNSIGYAVSVTGSTATVTLTKAGNLTGAQVNSLIDGLKYKDSGSNLTASNRTITLTGIQDDGGTSNGGVDSKTLTSAVSVSVLPLNHAPTLTATTSTPSFTEGGTAASLFSGSAVSLGGADVSPQTIQQIKFTISNVTDGANEIVTIDGTDVALTNATSVTSAGNSFISNVTLSGGTATVTITKAGNFTTAQAQSLVDGLTYKNTSNDPIAATRVVTLTQIKDDGGTGAGGTDSTTLTAHSDVTVNAVNNAPTLTATVTTPTVDHPSTFTAALFSGAAASVVEASQSINQITLTVSGLADGTAEKLKIDGSTVQLTNGTSGTSTGGNSIAYSVSVTGTTATVTLTKAGNMTGSVANALINGLQYENTNNNATVGNRVVTLTQIKDTGGTANGGTDTATVSLASTVTVAANDTPSISVPGGSNVTSDAVAQRTLTGVSIADNTNGTYTVTVSSSNAAGKVHLDGITGDVGANDSSTVTFHGTKAQVNTALGTLKYTAAGFGTDTVTVQVADDGTAYIGGAKSALATITMTETKTQPPPAPPPPPKADPAPVVVPTPIPPAAPSVPVVTIVRDSAAPSRDGGQPPPSAPVLTPQVSDRGTVAPVAVAAVNVVQAPAVITLTATGQLTAATSDGAFRVPVIAEAQRSAMGGEALVAVRPMAQVQETSAGFSFAVPSDTFAHTRPDAVVNLTAAQQDGQALPSWLAFNPKTGAFTGKPPAGFEGVVLVRVIARDQDGREAIATVRISVGEKSPPVPAPAKTGYHHRDKPVGKLAFTQQLKQASRHAALASLARWA
ncbi:hypothetical protein WV31_00060 [Magnetospirillum sp. ME-1]|nr:hypothetical protein WV31_00060 [Magnetospirillum sp. ME-1]